MSRSVAVGAVLGAWFAVTTVGASYLLGAHVAGLPLPSPHDQRVRAAVRARLVGRPLALHVLAVDCECSRRVLARLEVRAPRAEVDERLVLIGRDAGARRASRQVERLGYSVERLGPEDIAAALGVEVAPVLVVADASGEIVYLGGYTERKQGARIETDTLIDHALSGRSVAPLPVFGCAVTEDMLAGVDPWSLR